MFWSLYIYIYISYNMAKNWISKLYPNNQIKAFIEKTISTADPNRKHVKVNQFSWLGGWIAFFGMLVSYYVSHFLNGPRSLGFNRFLIEVWKVLRLPRKMRLMLLKYCTFHMIARYRIQERRRSQKRSMWRPKPRPPLPMLLLLHKMTSSATAHS